MNATSRTAALLLAGLLLGSGAAAHIPSARQVGDAYTEHNRVAGRAQALTLDVSLTLGDAAEIAATGTLQSHPNGAARLRLASPSGIEERHLWREGRVQASRAGQIISEPRPFLPPFPLFQVASTGDLLGRLASQAIAPHRVSLGYLDDHDCFVVGERGRGALWIDLDSLEPLRVDRPDGVRFAIGPPHQFGEVVLPSWIEARSDAGFRSRLAIEGVHLGPLSAEAFAPAWLLEPASGLPLPPPAP